MFVMNYTETHKPRHTRNAVKRIQREFGVTPLIDPLGNNPNYFAGIPIEELIKSWHLDEIERLVEIRDGVKKGYAPIKDNLKNSIMINFTKFLNNNFGTSVVYEPDTEPAYIDYHKILSTKEYRKKVNRKFNNLNRRLAVEEFFGSIEDKVKSYFTKEDR